MSPRGLQPGGRRLNFEGGSTSRECAHARISAVTEPSSGPRPASAPSRGCSWARGDARVADVPPPGRRVLRPASPADMLPLSGEVRGEGVGAGAKMASAPWGWRSSPEPLVPWAKRPSGDRSRGVQPQAGPGASRAKCPPGSGPGRGGGRLPGWCVALPHNRCIIGIPGKETPLPLRRCWRFLL